MKKNGQEGHYDPLSTLNIRTLEMMYCLHCIPLHCLLSVYRVSICDIVAEIRLNKKV